MAKNSNNNDNTKGSKPKKPRVISQEEKQMIEKKTQQAAEIAYCVNVLKMLTLTDKGKELSQSSRRLGNV